MARRTSARQIGAGALFAALVLGACDGDDTTSSGVVGAADAITAIVAWQADEQPPVLDDDGEAQLPVIFLVAGDGETLDVGIQADVTEAVVDMATVRFADDVADTFDTSLEGEPVRDQGVMLRIGPIPEPARTVVVDVDRFDSVDTWETLRLEITAAAADADALPRASVTSVTQP